MPNEFDTCWIMATITQSIVEERCIMHLDGGVKQGPDKNKTKQTVSEKMSLKMAKVSRF